MGKIKWRRRLRRVGTERKYHCEVCSKKFNYRNVWRQHKDDHLISI